MKLSRLRLLFPSRALATVLGVCSALAGFAEATVLVVLAQAALAVSSGKDSIDVDTGPLTLHVSLTGLIVAGFVALLVKLLLDVGSALAAAKLATTTLVKLRKETFSKFVRASWETQSAEREGFLQELATTHVARATQVTTAASMGLGALLNFLALLISAFFVSPAAAGILLAVAGGLFFALRPLSSLSRRYAKEQRGAQLEYVATVSEASGLAKEIRTFGIADEVSERVSAQVDAVAHPYHKANIVTQILPNMYQNIALLLILAVLGLLFALDLPGIASLGAVVLLLIRALLYTRTLQTTFHTVVEQTPYVEQLEERLERYEANAQPTGGELVGRIDSIAFEDASFSYVLGRPALTDVTCDVRRGEAIGIVGPSGAGKSTFVQLLLRLREPTSGAYLIDGRPASTLSFDDWYSAVAYVPQEPRLLDGSVRDNIRFLRDSIADEDIYRAAKLAQIHDDVLGWADGYDTPVGPRGGAVSGGQRQRLCLARALASRPSVLVLDEPTSALDVRSEALVQEALERMKGEVTLFVVAHRLSTLNICDRIMVFGGGRLEAFDASSGLVDDSTYFAQAVELSRLS